MILYAFLTETSVAKIFLGGAIPGLLLGLALMGVTHFWVVKRGYAPTHDRFPSWTELGRAILVATPALLIPLAVVVGLVGGIVTPAEAGVVACVAALVLSGLVYRELSLGDIVAAIRRAAHTTAVIWAVIAVSKVFSEILVRNLFTDRLLEGISWVTASPTGVLLVMTSMVFVLGMAIDTTPLLIMLAAPLHQAGVQVGVDPVHMGVILVMAALIGTVSPPVSLLLCLNCGIAKIPLSRTFGVIWSYLAVMLAVVLICILAPAVVTWLPGLPVFD